jgi:hypothetical protein
LTLDPNQFVNRIVMALPHEGRVLFGDRLHVFERGPALQRLPDRIERHVARENEIADFHTLDCRPFQHREIRGNMAAPEVDVGAVQMKQLAVQVPVAEFLVELQRHLRHLNRRGNIADQ